MEAGSVDLICCDPPFGTTSRNAWDVPLDMQAFFSECDRLIKPNGAIVIFAAQPFATDCINAYRRNFRYDLVWEKTMPVGFLNCNRCPLRSHELILVFYKKLPTFNPQKTAGKPYSSKNRSSSSSLNYGVYKPIASESLTGERFPVSVLKFGKNNKLKHPTAKPVPLLEWIVKTYSHEGEVILDPCAGSFSTGLACQNLNRNFIGIEQDEGFFKYGTELLNPSSEAASPSQ